MIIFVMGLLPRFLSLDTLVCFHKNRIRFVTRGINISEQFRNKLSKANTLPGLTGPSLMHASLSLATPLSPPPSPARCTTAPPGHRGFKPRPQVSYSYHLRSRGRTLGSIITSLRESAPIENQNQLDLFQTGPK
jgi:hypothetical protein